MDRVSKIIDQWQAERPDLDTTPMAIMGRMKRLSQHLGKGLEPIFAAHGLNSASFDVLATLRRAGPPYALTPGELLDWTMVTSGTMTHRLDRLDSDGLITRRRNPEDGRGSVVALSDTGLALIDGILAEYVASQHRLTKALDADEQALLNRLLAKWLTHFETDAPGE